MRQDTHKHNYTCGKPGVRHNDNHNAKLTKTPKITNTGMT